MDYTLTENDYLNLQKMIKSNDVEDQTELIRSTKHSIRIKEEVDAMYVLKKENPRLAEEKSEEFENMCISKCAFLFQNYTDIFNKIYKDEIDSTILYNFLDALKMIEDGKVDQHEASVKVGTYLKELYVDSALKKAEKLDAKAELENKKVTVEEPRIISWAEFKVQHLQS